MSKNNKSNIAVTIIFIIIQGITVVGYINQHIYKNLMSILLLTTIFLIYTYFKVKLNIYMKLYVTLLVILTILGHTLGGEYFGFYNKSNTYDKLLHIIGAYAFSLFIYTIICHFFPTVALNKWREFIFIILIGATVGMAFELMEFTTDVILRPAIPNQSDLLDTDLDMINDLIGALLAAIHVFISNFRIIVANS